ncbi:hypothetical protein VPH35_079889 [Triticum aestivum]
MPVAQAGGQPVAADSALSRRNRRRQKKSSNANAAAAAALVVAVPAPVLPTPMQRLFDTSHEVFTGSATGFVPPPDAVARPAAILSEHPLQRRRATWGSPVLLRWSCNATPMAELQRCVHGPQVIGGAAELRCSACTAAMEHGQAAAGAVMEQLPCCYGASPDHRRCDEAAPLLVWSIAGPPALQ